MGEAKRREKMGLPPREKKIQPPTIDKEKIKHKVRSTLYKYPVIPFIFYTFAIVILIFGVIGVLRFYK
tara:strand:- start:228 stop:431 length:204 start_codon:yes stop_codon:yes gene_type:complete